MSTALLGGCQALTDGDSDSNIVYNAPITRKIATGDFLPGTGVQYRGAVEERGAELNIDGQPSYKQAADSVDWTGSPVEGVDLDIGQRVVYFNEGGIQLAGQVKITVSDPSPQALQEIVSGPIEYSLPVTYNVRVGETIPGTLLVLQGIDPDRGALFAGWSDDQYGFRKVADSVEWNGSLRPGVGTNYHLRTAWLGEDSAQLVGLVDVVLSP